MNQESQEKFRRWICTPLNMLRLLPDGDGAFAALSICCGLFERFIDSYLHSRQISADPKEFIKAAALDLGCTEEAIERFWNGYRLGMQHSFQPKTYIQNNGTGDRWGWEIAEAEGFHHYPEIIETVPGTFVLRIDPWKFMNHVLNRWNENLALMDELSEFRFGRIASLPQSNSTLSNSCFNREEQECRTGNDRCIWPASTGVVPKSGNI